MNSSTVLNLFEECGALRRGHFLLSNGQHSDRYIECAAALQDPERSMELGEAVAELFLGESVDKVLSPALGGVLLGYEVARRLEVPFLFAESDSDGTPMLRRGFEMIAGERVLLVDDVLTRDSREPLELIELLSSRGAIPVGLGALVDRSNGTIKLPIPARTLVQLNVITYAADNCPLCKAEAPLETMGGQRADAREA